MNKIIILFLLALSVTTYSQSWTPKTAYWIYDAGFMTSRGDVRLSYLRDTMVQNENCQLLRIDIIEYNFINKKYSYKVYGNEVTLYKSGVTYILNKNKFDTLYYFSAKINDKFKITSKLTWDSNDSAYAVTIDTGQILINSIKLKWLAVDYNFKRYNQEYKLRDTIIEKIGATKYYFLPWDYINGMLDGNQGGSLKCYHDSLLGVYSNNTSSDCNFDISLNIASIDKLDDLKIFPNPADKEISINISNKQIGGTMLIYSASGQIIKSMNLYDNNIKLDTKDWIEGIYLILIQNNFGIKREKIIITHPNKSLANIRV